MIKLTRLDNREVAINPDHIAWVEATPDTTLSLIGDRKIIVRETLDEVVERFMAARAQLGCSPIGISAAGQTATSMPPNGGSQRPSNYARGSTRPALEGSSKTIRWSSPPAFLRRGGDEGSE